MLYIKKFLIYKPHVYISVSQVSESWDCVVAVVTSLQAGLSGVRIPTGAGDFSLPVNVLTGS
jgi:hypothetical protein